MAILAKKFPWLLDTYEFPVIKYTFHKIQYFNYISLYQNQSKMHCYTSQIRGNITNYCSSYQHSGMYRYYES